MSSAGAGASAECETDSRSAGNSSTSDDNARNHDAQTAVSKQTDAESRAEFGQNETTSEISAAASEMTTCSSRQLRESRPPRSTSEADVVETARTASAAYAGRIENIHASRHDESDEKNVSSSRRDQREVVVSE